MAVYVAAVVGVLAWKLPGQDPAAEARWRCPCFPDGQCVPNRPQFGYFQVRWQRWPGTVPGGNGAMGNEQPAQAAPGREPLRPGDRAAPPRRTPHEDQFDIPPELKGERLNPLQEPDLRDQPAPGEPAAPPARPPMSDEPPPMEEATPRNNTLPPDDTRPNENSAPMDDALPRAGDANRLTEPAVPDSQPNTPSVPDVPALPRSADPPQSQLRHAPEMDASPRELPSGPSDPFLNEPPIEPGSPFLDEPRNDRRLETSSNRSGLQPPPPSRAGRRDQDAAAWPNRLPPGAVSQARPVPQFDRPPVNVLRNRVAGPGRPAQFAQPVAEGEPGRIITLGAVPRAERRPVADANLSSRNPLRDLSPATGPAPNARGAEPAPLVEPLPPVDPTGSEQPPSRSNALRAR